MSLKVLFDMSFFRFLLVLLFAINFVALNVSADASTDVKPTAVRLLLNWKGYFQRLSVWFQCDLLKKKKNLNSVIVNKVLTIIELDTLTNQKLQELEKMSNQVKSPTHWQTVSIFNRNSFPGWVIEQQGIHWQQANPQSNICSILR
jgi:hypothetical protein